MELDLGQIYNVRSVTIFRVTDTEDWSHEFSVLVLNDQNKTKGLFRVKFDSSEYQSVDTFTVRDLRLMELQAKTQWLPTANQRLSDSSALIVEVYLENPSLHAILLIIPTDANYSLVRQYVINFTQQKRLIVLDKLSQERAETNAT